MKALVLRKHGSLDDLEVVFGRSQVMLLRDQPAVADPVTHDMQGEFGCQFGIERNGDAFHVTFPPCRPI